MRRLGIDARLKVRAAMDGSLIRHTPRAVEERRIERAMAAPVDTTPLFSLPPRHTARYCTEPIKAARVKRPLCLEDEYCLAHPRVAAAMYAAWNEDRDFELI